MAEKSSLQAVEVTLGNPVAPEYTNNALKVRRNLLAVSLVSCFIAFFSIKLDPNSTIFGFKFVGLTDDLVSIGLVVFTIYHLAHFAWYVVDAAMEWRLRVTGTRLSFVTAGKLVSEHGDYPDDPRQSTLYSWWKDHARSIGNIKEIIITFEKEWEIAESAVQALVSNNTPDGRNLNNALQTLGQVQKSVFDLKRSVEQVDKTISSQRIPASLSRFDKWFGLFLRSQNLRWLLIDTCVPLAFGIIALLMLLIKLLR